MASTHTASLRVEVTTFTRNEKNALTRRARVVQRSLSSQYSDLHPIAAALHTSTYFKCYELTHATLMLWDAASEEQHAKWGSMATWQLGSIVWQHKYTPGFADMIRHALGITEKRAKRERPLLRFRPHNWQVIAGGRAG